MNKSDLIEQISKLPDDIDILTAKDDEGNGYRWVQGVSLEYIDKSEDSGWEAECVMSEEDLEDLDYDEEEVAKYLKKVIVIW